MSREAATAVDDEPIALGRPRRGTLYWQGGRRMPGPGDVLRSTSPVRQVERSQLILQATEIQPRTVAGEQWRRLRYDAVTIVPGTEPRDAWCVEVQRGLPTEARRG